jgi:hypothetical protein
VGRTLVVPFLSAHGLQAIRCGDSGWIRHGARLPDAWRIWPVPRRPFGIAHLDENADA